MNLENIHNTINSLRLIIEISSDKEEMRSLVINIIKKSNLERNIKKYAECSYFYALEILRERFYDGEEIISKDGFFSYLYAIDIIKGRFELGEKEIFKNVFLEFSYKDKINVKK